MIWKLFLKRLKVEMYFFRSGLTEGNYQKIQNKSNTQAPFDCVQHSTLMAVLVKGVSSVNY